MARPGRSTVDELPGRADPLLAVRRGVGRREPGRRRRGRRGPRRGAGRGLAAGRPRPGGGSRRRAATSAGSTCVPGRAARPRCWPRWRATRGARVVANELPAPPCRAGTPHPRRRRRRRVRDRRGRHRAALARRVLRPGARRRALHRSGCPAAPPRGALAASARGPARAGAAAARPARPGARPGPARRGGALRDLLAGARRDPRRARLAPGRARRRQLGDTPRSSPPRPACAPTYPTAPGPLAGTAQLWPHRHRTDAMFLALFRAPDR